MRARFAALVVVATACTFPDITVVVQEDPSAGGGGSSASAGGDGGAPATTSTESTTSSMTTTSSTSMMSAGGGGSGGGCPDVDGDMDPSILCGGTDCDDDGDTVQVEFEGCCVAPGCDCVDSNADVYPGQAAWFGEPWDGVDDYDYSCSFFEEPRYTTSCPQGGILSCGDGKALQAATPCGEPGNARTCSGILGSCSPSGSVYSLLQECH
jgi:hypothetical protein